MMTTTYDQLTVTYDQSTLTYQGLPAQFDGVAFAVEMAFGYNPLDDDLSWESVTPYVRGFSTDRGRTSEFVDYSPGTASILLDNRDRRFDPEYVSGPYYGQLNPMVPVRIQATYSGVTYTMYTGFVQGWPTAYNQSNTDAVATVNCVDANRLLANLKLEKSAFAKELIDDNAYVYWPMQSYYKYKDTTGTYAFINRTDDYYSEKYAYTFESPTLATQEQGLPVGSDNSIDGPVWRYSSGVLGTPQFLLPEMSALEFWWDATEHPSWTSNWEPSGSVYRAGTGRAMFFSVILQWNAAAGEWRLRGVYYQTQESSLYGSNASINQPLGDLSGANHILGTREGTNFKVYLNGSLIYTLALSSSGSISVGSSVDAFQFSSGAVAGVESRYFSNFSATTTQLSAAQALAHYESGLAYPGELSSARLNRVLDDVGWPASLRQIETGAQPVGAYRPESLPVVRYMGQIESAEQGALFVNAEGEVEFQSRTTADTPVIAAFFDDNGTDLPFAGVSVDAHTVDAIRNNVVVNYAYGSTVSTDSGSVAAYGTATQTVDAQLVDDPAVAQSIGDNLLARAKNPRTRITSLQVNMRRDPANLIPAVASLDLADDVVVSLTPTGVGSALWRAVRVQGITHRVTPQSWDVSLYLAPGPINTNGPLMILDDGTYGVLDSNKLG